MSFVFGVIKDVNTYLTLLAFIVACILTAYVLRLRSREKIETAAVEANNQQVIARITLLYGMQTENLGPAEIKPVLLAEIHRKTKRNTTIAVVMIVAVVAIATVAIASFFVSSTKAPRGASVGGGLGVLVNAINAAPDRFSITLADQGLTNFWVADASGMTTKDIIAKICNINTCLTCAPQDIASATHVTIRLSGKVESFRDQFGSSWLHCASI